MVHAGRLNVLSRGEHLQTRQALLIAQAIVQAEQGERDAKNARIAGLRGPWRRQHDDGTRPPRNSPCSDRCSAAGCLTCRVGPHL